MATVLVVPQEDWKVMTKYLHNDSSVILIPQYVYDNLPDLEKKLIDGSVGSDYFNMSDADVWVDFVYDENANYLDHARSIASEINDDG